MAKGYGPKKANGYLLFEDEQLIVVATGFSRKSSNSKTGAMIQTWILNRNDDPVTAVKTGIDSVVCGDCPLRGINGKARACYVTLHQAPLSVWKAYHRGIYKPVSDYSIFDGRVVRFGSYGEPVKLPVPTIKAIVAHATGWTGYTHQWRNPVYQAYREFLMASTSAADYQEAIALGWRVFAVSSSKLDGLVVCPASAESGHRTTCEHCGLCQGTSKRARSIQIQPHGAGAKYAAAA
jgi:hypothetical protein